MQHDEFELTVGIPNYNNGKYLSACIESIMQQTFLPKEIIIIDDCSNDDSKDIILNLQQQYPLIKPIFLYENQGVSNARNTAILACKTTYVTFIDADDFYCNPDKLKNEMTLIKRYVSEKVLAYSYTAIYDEGGIVTKPEKKRENHLQGNVLMEYMKGRGKIIIARDYCINKQLLIDAGMYIENQNLYEDLDLLIRLANTCKYYCTFDYGTAYRLVPNGLSKRLPEEHEIAKTMIRKKYLQYVSLTQKIYLHIYWTLIKIYRKQ